MDDFLKAVTYNYPEKIPVLATFLPASYLKYGEELIKIAHEYEDLPGLFPRIESIDEVDKYISEKYQEGETVDEWGCVWSNINKGMDSYVTGHPVKTREDILELKIPENRDGNIPHGFMYLRLLDLRGFEEAMIDFAEEPPELQILIDKVLEYNLRQIEVALSKMDKVVYFGDDLGTQHGIAIGPNKWRKYLKPCYKKMYQMVRQTGRYIYMHSDGQIYEIMPDLVQCGVNIINPQFRANGLDNLVRVCKGKIPIFLDLDRQLFPFATPSEIDDHVRECVEALYLPEGGLGLNVELSPDIPLENMVAVLDAVRKYRNYTG